MYSAQFQALLTGHHEIDQQHRQLILLLDQLATARNAYDANKVVRDLLAFWQEHHQSEERWMRAFDFEFEADHKAQHEALNVFFANLRHLVNSLSFLDELPNHVELIFEKLKHHIVTYDMQFCSHLPPSAARA